jgi:glycosyltransferase involved in cell wall biosynthesis
MNSTDLLTIAIPCYERKDFILEALESALNQTVKCKIIVVDNCSSHNYFEKICQEKGVTYYKNEKNIGLFPNINRCYELADTEYVKILDDDDLLLPTYVESFLKAHKLHPDIDVYYTNYLLLSAKGEKPNKEILPFGYLPNGEKVLEYGILHRLGFPYMTAAIKKSKAKLDLDHKICMGGYDWVWVYSKSTRLSFFGDSQRLHKYRYHENKASRGKGWSANLLTYSYIYELVIPKIITDNKLVKLAKKTAFEELMSLKSYGNTSELKLIMQGDNRFGNYLKEKLNESLKLRIIFFLPKRWIWLITFLHRKKNRLFHNHDLKNI